MWGVRQVLITGLCGSVILIAGLFLFRPLIGSEVQYQSFEEPRVLANPSRSAAEVAGSLTNSNYESTAPTHELAIDRAVPASSSELVTIGDYIDPDRGPDFSEPVNRVEIGDYIDPERGPDWSSPEPPLSVGDYLDPDRGAVFEVNPIEVLSIGQFIDPDAVITLSEDGPVEVGEYRDPEDL